MNAFVFAQQYNTPENPDLAADNPILCVATGPAPPGVTPTHACDATGSFQSGAIRLRNAHGFPQRAFLYDNTLRAPQRRNSIFQALQSVPDASLDLIAYFGHGTHNGLESACIHNSDLPVFAPLIRRKCKPNADVVFYACGTGRAGGFAQMLGDRLGDGIWVYGHTGRGSYANLSMFRRYPGGVRLTAGGNIYHFWKREREAWAQASELAARTAPR